MLSVAEIRVVLSQSVEALRESNLIEDDFSIASDSVIFGTSSPLDSIAFVTLIADIEDRLSLACGREICVVLTDVGDFNESAPLLTVGVLETYLAKLTAA